MRKINIKIEKVSSRKEMVSTQMKREKHNKTFYLEYARTFRFCHPSQKLSMKVSINYFSKFIHSQEGYKI